MINIAKSFQKPHNYHTISKSPNNYQKHTKYLAHPPTEGMLWSDYVNSNILHPGPNPQYRSFWDGQKYGGKMAVK